jgi:hypothetical protein
MSTMGRGKCGYVDEMNEPSWSTVHGGHGINKDKKDMCSEPGDRLVINVNYPL